MNAFRAILFAAANFLFWTSPPLPAADFEIDNYTPVSSTRISRTLYEYTYKADVSNWSNTDSNITATVTSTAPQITVTQNALSFGDVPYGATQESTDTFTVRHDRSKPFDTAALVWSVNATPLPPTTFELIDQALADGAIDAETALVYKVYSESNDGRLPQPYQGRDDQFFEATATKEARRLFDTLSPASQQILAPLLLQFPDFSEAAALAAGASPQISSASATGSVPDGCITITHWGRLEIVPGVISVGWDADSVLAAVNEEWANRIKAEVQARIWPKLTGFLGTPAAGKKILICLDDVGSRPNEEDTDDCLTAKIRLKTERKSVYAHELTHALIDLNYPGQCNVAEFFWMHEATAQWAQHFVYPPGNSGDEQYAAPSLLQRPELALDTYERGSHTGHQYGAYLWFFRLAGQGNNPAVVRAIWDATASQSPYLSGLDAIDTAIQGGFDKQWPAFVLDNWNRVAALGKPYRNYFHWDRLRTRASEANFELSLQGAAGQVIPIQYVLPRLSATYRHFNFKSDRNIRGVWFMNKDAGTIPTASVQAIVKMKGKDWQLAEDWSNEKEKFFCRDKVEEDLEEVVIVIANKGFQSADPEINDNGAFSLFYSAFPCHDWIGSTTYRQEFTAAGGTGVLTANGTNLRFRIQPQNSAVWRPIDGVINWRHDSTSPFEDGSCTAASSGSFAAKDRGQFTLLPLVEAGNKLVFAGNVLPPTPVVTVSGTCRSSSGTFLIEGDFDPGSHWFDTGPTPWLFDNDIAGISGFYSSTSTDETERWTWDLSKAP